MLDCVNKLLKNAKNSEYKELIYNDVLMLMDWIDKFINYEYEEDILNLFIVIFNDLKLIPPIYYNIIDKYLDKFNENKLILFV